MRSRRLVSARIQLSLVRCGVTVCGRRGRTGSYPDKPAAAARLARGERHPDRQALGVSRATIYHHADVITEPDPS